MEMEKEQIMEFLQVSENKWDAYHKKMMAILDAHHGGLFWTDEGHGFQGKSGEDGAKSRRK
jgi:hypothetical protein